MALTLDPEAALLASPRDLDCCERYGKWLEERGDPRAELILHECLVERNRTPKWNAERRAELLPQQANELRALAPHLFEHEWQVCWRRGLVSELTLRRPRTSTSAERDRLEAVLRHPYCRFLTSLCLESVGHEGGAGLLQCIAANCSPSIEYLFVEGASRISLDPIGRLFKLPGRVVTYSHESSFGAGPFHQVRVLDLRDRTLTWDPSGSDVAWPDLEILILRPRGDRADWLRYCEAILGSARAMPRLRELWACESGGDQFLNLLVESPVLQQLRRIDLTDSITNAGAQVLYAHAARLSGVEQICVGSTGEWRRSVMNMRSAVKLGDPAPPLGALEIDGAWRSRLKQRFGKRVSYRIPAGHPNLGWSLLRW